MATQWTAGTTSGQVLTAATLNTIGAAWESYTPTVKGGATTLTGTVNYAKYCQVQKTVIVQVLFTSSSVGAANGILSVSYPVGLTPVSLNGRPIGDFILIDISAGYFTGVAKCSSGGATGRGTNSTDDMGANTPTMTVASGDIIGMNITYEVA